MQTVDHVKALIACNVFAVAGRLVTGNNVGRVKGA